MNLAGAKVLLAHYFLASIMGPTLIFDYDGVIVDSLDLFMRFFIEACKKEGFEEIGSKEIFLSLFDGNMFEKMAQKGMSRGQILHIMLFMKEKLLRNQGKLQVFKGMKQTLSTLSEQYPLYIITSNESNVVKQFLISQELAVFKDIYGSDKEPSKVKKIHHIKQQNNSDKVFYIGDTVGDIMEGKQAGVQTIAVTWGWHDEEKLQKSGPSYIVSHPTDLLGLFV